MRLRMSGSRMRTLAEAVDEQIHQQECEIERLYQQWTRLLGYGMPEQELRQRTKTVLDRLEELKSIRSDIRSQLRIK